MPKIVQHLRVFIASPGDVQPERSRIEKAIRELNLSLSTQDVSIQLESVSWDTHAYPSFGQAPQTVINEQLGTDYDIFIGILWSRIGTPTPKYPSGTLEEFQAAYKKWTVDPNSITLMMYFKDEPVAPSQLDPDQLAQVQNFKKGLPASGGLYWDFKTVDDFEATVRLHLTRAVQDWRARLKHISKPKHNAAPSVSATVVESLQVSTPPAVVDEGDDTELGFLDYMELVAEASERNLAVLSRITSAMELIGTQTDKRTAETKALTGQPDLAEARLVFERSARDLNEFSSALLRETPQMSQAHADLLKYLVGGAASSLEIGAAGKQQVFEVMAQLDSFTEAINTSRSHTREFRTNIAALLPMTATFNKAKRRALEVLDMLDSAFAGLVARNTRVRAEIAYLLDRTDGGR